MKKAKFKDSIVEFIKKSTCSFTCVDQIKKELLENGYVQLLENEVWELNKSKYFVIRNDASIIAFELPPKRCNSFCIITTHSDTPSLLLKPSGAYTKSGYLKYNIMPYGGLLNCGWLDHPLSLAGRVVVNSNDNLRIKIVDFKSPLMIVPSVAIHQNSKANTNLDLNMQNDLQPILSTTGNNTWDSILKKYIKEEIVDYDLFAYNIDVPLYIGDKDELLVSPRIDNLTSVYAGYQAFLKNSSSNIKVFCSFNNEEIGSLTQEGADSNFLLDILKRIAVAIDIDITIALDNSFIINSDNTHAIHPNHSEFSDDTGIIYLNSGFAIIKEINSTTNALSSSIIKYICKKNNINYQVSTAKNDIAGGSTLSGINIRHVSVLSVDVGIPQLSMHSSLETCALNDIYELYRMMSIFYKTKIIKEKDKIIIK